MATKEVFSKILLVGVTSALLIGVVFFACVDIERRPVVEVTDSTVALTVERRALLGFTGLLMLLRAGPVELLRLRFKEEFSLPERRHKSRIVAHSDCLVTARLKLTIFFLLGGGSSVIIHHKNNNQGCLIEAYLHILSAMNVVKGASPKY